MHSADSAVLATVEYGGQWAFATRLGKKDEPESGTHQMTVDGRASFFENGVVKFAHKTFDRDAKADANWKAHKS